MRSLLAVVTLTAIASTDLVAQGTVALTKTGVAAEAKTDQRDMMTPETGKQFLWVSATASGAAQTIDLTTVTLTSGAASYPLIGVDSVWDGDPSQFQMIAPVTLKTGKVRPPLEETRSEGSLAFAFTPGKAATLKVLQPGAKFCLLFLVPQSVRTGHVKGLTAAALPLPTDAR